MSITLIDSVSAAVNMYVHFSFNKYHYLSKLYRGINNFIVYLMLNELKADEDFPQELYVVVWVILKAFQQLALAAIILKAFQRLHSLFFSRCLIKENDYPKVKF